MKLTKQITSESKAWVEVARVLGNGKPFTSEFICHVLRFTPSPVTTRVPWALRDEMCRFVRALVEPTEGVAYPGHYGDQAEEREARITACLLFSEMAKDGETWIEEAV